MHEDLTQNLKVSVSSEDYTMGKIRSSFWLNPKSDLDCAVDPPQIQQAAQTLYAVNSRSF